MFIYVFFVKGKSIVVVFFNVYKWHSSYSHHEHNKIGRLNNSNIDKLVDEKFTKRYGRHKRKHGRC